MTEPLHELEPGVIVRPMLTMNRAIDLFLGDFARRGCTDRAAYSYSRTLQRFADRLPNDGDVSRITAEDIRRFLDLFNRKAAGTRATTYAHLSSFFNWLIDTEQIKRSPMVGIPRPKRQRSEDLDVTTVTADDVRRLLAAGETWTERLAVAIAVYMGPRRRAIAQLRLTDYNRETGKIRFREKGGKTIWKPVPDELANMLEAAIDAGAIKDPDDYLVPPEGHLVRGGVRDDRVIWRVVKRVAGRAGVETHVHALRAAFAVMVLEQFEQPYMAQKALGHINPQTTQVYLRKLNTETVLEPMRGLSWDAEPAPVVDELAALRARNAELESRMAAYEASHQMLGASPVVGAGGFEPPNMATPHGERAGASDLVGVLRDSAASVSDQATVDA